MRSVLAPLFLTICLVAPARGAGDTRLPDGTDFKFWEQPLTFTRTYYVDGGSPGSDDRGPGSQSHPFRTINQAAELLQPGERVVIAAGIYRECVRPARGGTAANKMISYEAAPGAKVIIRASEVLRDWQPTGDPHIWRHELTGAMFPDAYNPFAMVTIPGDWSWLNTKSVDMGPYLRRRGLIFIDGKPLEPMEQYRELGNVPLQPAAPPGNGLPGRSRGGPIVQEIGGSPELRFWVEHQGNVLYIRTPTDPAKSLVEVTTREQAFVPRVPGLGYIRIKGLTFQQAGNAFPPPQRGLVSTNSGNHWIIEDNTIEWAGGVGLDIGAPHWSAERVPNAGESQIVRGNTIRYLGVEGLGGMATDNTLVEDNLIEWIGWEDAERGWESAGAKLHFARNLLFRRNVIRHMRHANALWLDSRNVNVRVTNNVFADVLTVSAAVHSEMNRDANQYDHNIIWDVRNAEPGTPGQRGAAGAGFFLHASEHQVITNNLVGRCDNVGVWPILRPERRSAGNGQGYHINDNIFTRCGKGGIVFLHDNNQADGNVYAAMPEKFGGLAQGDATQWLDLAGWRAHGWDRKGALVPLDISFDPDRLELRVKGDVSRLTDGGRKSPGPFDVFESRNADPRLISPRAGRRE